MKAIRRMQVIHVSWQAVNSSFSIFPLSRRQLTACSFVSASFAVCRFAMSTQNVHLIANPARTRTAFENGGHMQHESVMDIGKLFVLVTRRFNFGTDSARNILDALPPCIDVQTLIQDCLRMQVQVDLWSILRCDYVDDLQSERWRRRRIHVQGNQRPRWGNYISNAPQPG